MFNVYGDKDFKFITDKSYGRRHNKRVRAVWGPFICEDNYFQLRISYFIRQGTWRWTDDMRASEPSMLSCNNHTHPFLYLETELQISCNLYVWTDIAKNYVCNVCMMGKSCRIRLVDLVCENSSLFAYLYFVNIM